MSNESIGKIFCISSTKNKDEQILNIAWLFSCADRPRQMKQDKKLATAKNYHLHF